MNEEIKKVAVEINYLEYFFNGEDYPEPLYNQSYRSEYVICLYEEEPFIAYYDFNVWRWRHVDPDGKNPYVLYDGFTWMYFPEDSN